MSFAWLILNIIIPLLVAGVFLWAVNALPGIDATIKQIARIIVIVVLVIWLLYILAALFGGGMALPHPVR